MWVERGEKPTKYFFNLEERNYSKKVISELEYKDGEIINNEEQILLEIENYYKTLYSSKVDVTEEQLNRYIEHLEITHLSHEVSEKVDGLLTLEECKKSFDTFSPRKSMGEDDLPSRRTRLYRPHLFRVPKYKVLYPGCATMV